MNVIIFGLLWKVLFPIYVLGFILLAGKVVVDALNSTPDSLTMDWKRFGLSFLWPLVLVSKERDYLLNGE